MANAIYQSLIINAEVNGLSPWKYLEWLLSEIKLKRILLAIYLCQRKHMKNVKLAPSVLKNINTTSKKKPEYYSIWKNYSISGYLAYTHHSIQRLQYSSYMSSALRFFQLSASFTGKIYDWNIEQAPSNFDNFILHKFKGGRKTAMLSNTIKSKYSTWLTLESTLNTQSILMPIFYRRLIGQQTLWKY